MCNCINELKELCTKRFGEYGGNGAITEQLPCFGRGLGADFSSRALLIGYRKYMNLPALFCPFCGEKYKADEEPGVEQSLSYVQKKKGDEITRLPR